MAARVRRRRSRRAESVRTLREIQYDIWKLTNRNESFEEFLHRLKTSLDEMRAEAEQQLKEEGPTELAIVAGQLVRKKVTRH